MNEIRGDTFRMIACPTLSHETRQDRYVPEGASIGEALRDCGWRTEKITARVFIDGQLIPDAEWEMATPKAGQAVVVRRVLSGGGGGGGNSGKQIGMIVGMMALLVASFFVPPLLAGAAGLMGLGQSAMVSIMAASTYIQAGFLIAGSLALNALIKPASPKVGDLSDLRGSQALSLTGVSNQAAPYGRIPRLYGKQRIYPTLAARPYTEIVGNTQYMRILYCLGYGPLAFSRDDILLGETPLTDFTNVTMEVTYGFEGESYDNVLTVVPNDVVEDALSLKMTAALSWQQRTTQLNAKGISIDMTFPEGIILYDSQGNSYQRSIAFEIEYREVNTIPWTAVSGTTSVSSTATTSFTGADNDLTFTKTATGARGNSNMIRFVAGAALKTERSQIQVPRRPGFPPQFNYSDIAVITVVNGVTTASQVITSFNANSDLTSIMSVANAVGNNGTGAIMLPSTPYYNIYFSGGKDGIPSFWGIGKSRSLIRKSIQWDVVTPGKQYDVRIRRLTADAATPPDTAYDTSYWTMLRTIQASAPVIQKPGLCMIGLRIKATDQLNGVVDNLNVVAESILEDWDATSNSWVLRQTSNPASVYRDVLMGTANRRPKTIDQLDLPTIQAFHTRCVESGYTFNAVIDYQTTVKQLRQDVLAAGRAAFGLRDMKYSVIEDLLQTTPVDIITPRTSSNFKWTKRFIQMPHAFRVRFVDEENNYKQSEMIVYSDGFNATNTTDYEEVEAGLGVTNPAQVKKLKRREMADALLRADDYEVMMDFANLNCTRGDRVQLQHDVILAGLITARIKTVSVDGGSNATGVTFDEPFVMADGTNYGARIRRSNGAHVVQQVVTVAGETTSVTFTAVIPAATAPAIGDLVTFGVLGLETIDCIVKNIEPGPDFTATLMLQDYAPGIHDADLVIPEYDGQVTWPDVPAPPLPQVIQVISDEFVLVRDIDGSLQSRILVSVHFPSGSRDITSRIETQFRETGSDDEWKVVFSNVTASSVEVSIAPVEDALLYDIRLRSVDDRGYTSAWASIDAHQVIGKSSAPPDVTSLTVEDDRLRWTYDAPPKDLLGFYVRYRAGTSKEWDSAIAAHTQAILTTDFQIFRQSTVSTYLVKAVDVAGNLSANAASVTVSFTDELISNIVLEVDHDALNFPGTKTNCSVIGGDLKAAGSTPFWTSDTAIMWPYGASSLYWVGAFSAMTYEFSYAPPSNLLDAILRLPMTATGEYKIEYRPDSGVSMWNVSSGVLMWNAVTTTLMWSAKGNYMAWPGSLTPISSINYDFRVVGNAGSTQVTIDQLSLIFDVRDIQEEFANLALSAGGTRLPITKTYRTIVVVNVTLDHDGGTAIYVKTIDKHATAGPLIQAFDAAGVGVEATVDVIIQGY